MRLQPKLYEWNKHSPLEVKCQMLAEGVKITPISKWLFRVEICKPGGYWVTVHDCPGIPWSDVVKYLPAPTDQPPPPNWGVVQSVRVCDWCGTNKGRYLAVSDAGKQLICGVCAADIQILSGEVQ